MSITVRFNRNHKSISAPFTIELPDLTVITGVNGSGKTHLLTGIEQKAASMIMQGKSLNRIKYYSTNTFAPNSAQVANKESTYKHSTALINMIDNYRLNKAKGSAETLNLTSELGLILKGILSVSKKTIDDIDHEDVFDYYPLWQINDDKLNKDNIIYNNLNSLFKRYSDRWNKNEFRKFLNTKGGTYSVLSEEEFHESFGPPPWNIISEIMLEAGLEYEAKDPGLTDRDSPFRLSLTRPDGVVVPFSDLSSGEKVLMSLALALYNAESNYDLPEVLLLDEADAHLHPSMSKNFIDIIKEVFVKRNGIKVLVATHNASTVAFAPEESIYIMDKASRRLVKGSKDQALAHLVAGVPSYSVSYENRRQIFVESHYDASLFESAYRAVSRELELPEVSLSFIASAADGNGDCEKVKSFVNEFRNSGNTNIFGFVDWDGKGLSAQDGIFTIGYNERYSIENYVLDPLTFICFTLKFGKKKSEYFELPSNMRYFEISSLALDVVQRACDKYFTDLKLNINDAKNEQLVSIRHKVGALLYPKWFLEHHGHSLVTALKATYPYINLDPTTGRSYKNDNTMISFIGKSIYSDLPMLVPIDFIDAFNAIKCHGIVKEK